MTDYQYQSIIKMVRMIISNSSDIDEALSRLDELEGKKTKRPAKKTVSKKAGRKSTGK